jgi:hypothetical protein
MYEVYLKRSKNLLPMQNFVSVSHDVPADVCETDYIYAN